MRDIIKQVASNNFGLQNLAGGIQTVTNGNQQIEAFVHYLWIVSLPQDGLHMAGAYIMPSKSNNYPGCHQNILWMQHFDDNQPVGEICAVQKSLDETDDIAEALKTMNLLPLMLEIGLDLSDSLVYEVFCVTVCGEAYLKYDGRPQSIQQRQFVKVFINRLFELGSRCENPVIKHYLQFLQPL